MDKKTFYGILIVSVFTIIIVTAGTFLLSKKSNPLSRYPDTHRVTVTTDKTEYIQGETVKIIIKNSSKAEILIYPPPYYFIQKYENGAWTTIRSEPCPCLACGAPVATTLPPNTKEQFVWDQNVARCNQLKEDAKNQADYETLLQLVPQGKYRVGGRITVVTNSYDEVLPAIVYSKEFVIKVK